MSVEDYPVSFSFEVNVEPGLQNVRKLQSVVYRSLGLVSRLTGDENLQRGIGTIQHYISMLNRLRLAYLAVQAARMAAGDPLAWATAGVAVATVGVDISMELEGY